MGVPTLGCGCAVCTSSDPRDRRLRPSVLLRWREQAGGRERVVVIDTGPDFREQALRNGLTRVDAVFYTHSHADHILGMDDLRPLSFTVFREGAPIPLYATPETTVVLGAHLRLHLFAERHLSDPRPRRTAAAGRADSGLRRRVPARAAAARRDGDCRLSLWPRRLSDRRERHPRIELRAARRAGPPGPLRAAPQAAPQPRHRGAGGRLGHCASARATPGSPTSPTNWATNKPTTRCPTAFAWLRRPQPARESGDRALMTEGHVISVFHSVAEIPAGFGPSVASIGNFDGVHLGHQQILSAVAREAREQVEREPRARAVAITFDPSPGAVSAPGPGAAPAYAHQRAPAPAVPHRH
jgi:hypothetical protein